MKIKFLKKDGYVIDKNTAIRKSPHLDNLKYLSNNPILDGKIRYYIKQHIHIFLQSILIAKDGYLNSGGVSVNVCNSASLPQDKFHHGLAGSALLDELEGIDPTQYNLSGNITVVASKGQDQTWFDYFPDRNSI